MNKLFLTTAFLIISAYSAMCQNSVHTYKEHIRKGLPEKKEIDVFLNEISWAKFDPELGYVLGNYVPRDGIDNSSTISTAPVVGGPRRSFLYTDRPCRINTYGNSFTQCHQVSDGETWQEYLAAHLGEPVRNFGMGGYGVNQSYRRLLRHEKTADQAENLVFYIYGDDHIRSLLRCRYMILHWWNRETNKGEGLGKMFHGNFWSNIEMNLQTGKLEEHESRIKRKQDLYKMTDENWMFENLKDDLALQMVLFRDGEISDINIAELKKLAVHLNFKVNLDDKSTLRHAVSKLLNKYAFASTKFILNKVKDFAEANNKKLMVVLFDPYEVTKPLLSGKKERYDQEIVDFLKAGSFNYFDMNLVHVEDFKSFKLSVDDYFNRYFIGHYSPAGNHFFAYSMKTKIVELLNPKPTTYQNTEQKMIDFKGYLQGF
jgi:hypothetical protein